MTPAVPDPTTLPIESLIPHRDRMLLVDEILEIDDRQAITLAVVKPSWPFCVSGAVDPLIVIELVAQTAGIHNGLEWHRKIKAKEPAAGWLVGVKQAAFHVAAIPVGERITTTARNVYVFENLREIVGTASVADALVAEVTLQVMEAD